jgi:hypothetical protein
MTTHRDDEGLAVAAGRSWAELKAETLEAGDVPAVAWPDVWDPAWAERLELGPGAVDDRARAAALVVANHAAAERWRELIRDRRDAEDLEDEEHDAEASARRLLGLLRDDLPPGLRADHDGARVFLVDDDGGERTVQSLEHAFRVIAEYEEHRSLRTS